MQGARGRRDGLGNPHGRAAHEYRVPADAQQGDVGQRQQGHEGLDPDQGADRSAPSPLQRPTAEPAPLQRSQLPNTMPKTSSLPDRTLSNSRVSVT